MQRFLSLLVLTTVVSCSSPEIDYEYGRASFAGVGSAFAWAAPTKSEAATEAPDELVSFVRTTTEQQLVAKGYKIDETHPDFVVASRTSKRSMVTRPGWDIKQYEEGSLELFIYSAQSQELLWRSRARAALDPTLTPTQRRDRIQETVKDMLKNFPDQGKEPKR